MYYVYIIRSEVDGRLYKGITKNIKNRIREHNSGKTRSTKAYKAWELVYSERFPTIEEARKRELLKQILDP